MSERIRELISEKDIAKRIVELGAQISADYQGESVFMLCVLKGGVYFTTELSKRMSVPVSLDFMAVSSYGMETESSGVVKIIKDLDESIEGKNVLVVDIKGKHVLLVEDIIDSGRTLSLLLENLRQRKPKTLKLCTLLNKPARRVTDIQVDYVGYEIPDEFVVGYGMDYAQKYRNLPYIGVVEFE